MSYHVLLDDNVLSRRVAISEQPLMTLQDNDLVKISVMWQYISLVAISKKEIELLLAQLRKYAIGVSVKFPSSDENRETEKKEEEN